MPAGWTGGRPRRQRPYFRLLNVLIVFWFQYGNIAAVKGNITAVNEGQKGTMQYSNVIINVVVRPSVSLRQKATRTQWNEFAVWRSFVMECRSANACPRGASESKETSHGHNNHIRGAVRVRS